MKSRLYKGFLSFVFIFLALIFFSVSSYAATGFEGFAIYRNGAFLGTTWHAGLMDEAHPKKSLPVIHVGQSNDAVVFDSWENFINKKTSNNNAFEGFYYPKSGIPSSAKRNAIKALARNLRTKNLLYTATKQIDYVNSSNTKVEPNELTHCRCDGLVEYCYEYNDIRIYGNNSYWNISIRGSEYLNHHSLTSITPEKQAKNYMNKWTPNNKVIYIVNKKSGKAFDVRGPSSANGAIIQQWDYSNLSNQKFKLVYTSSGSYYSFIPQNATGSAVEVQNNSSTNGAPIQIWAKPSTYLNSQRFRIVQNSVGAYKITTNGSGYSKVLDVTSGGLGNGVPLQVWTDNGTDAQQWFFVPA